MNESDVSYLLEIVIWLSKEIENGSECVPEVFDLFTINRLVVELEDLEAVADYERRKSEGIRYTSL